MNSLYQNILDGDRRALAKGITLIESKSPTHQEDAQRLLSQLLPHTGKSFRIGITGVPGVGKSTFIEALGLHLISLGKKVAVLAVDPSSPVSGGSLLGDKTRMEELSQKENAFIRPSPSGGALGGIARKTREAMLLCEAANYDIILIETVGVGQSEYEVYEMVDFFLVLMLPNAGDELQGIKKGILELADALVINKDDGQHKDQAQLACQQYQNAFHILLPKNSSWIPFVMTCSAIEGINISSVWNQIDRYREQYFSSNHHKQKRNYQNLQWLWKLTQEMFEHKIRTDQRTKDLIPQLENEVSGGTILPLPAAQKIVSTLFPS